MLPVLLGVPGKLKTLIDRLTATRAGYLDNLTDLDTTVSSRAPATDTATLVSRLTAARAANLDSIPKTGPPSASWTTLPANGTADLINICSSGSGIYTTGSTAVPTGATYTTILTITGDSVLWFCAFYDSVSTSKTWTIQVEVNSVTYDFTAGPMGISSQTIIGGVTGSKSTSSGVLNFTPVFCPGNFVLRLKHDIGTTASVYGFYKYLPV